MEGTVMTQAISAISMCDTPKGGMIYPLARVSKPSSGRALVRKEKSCGDTVQTRNVVRGR